jgi:hypothetical protein
MNIYTKPLEFGISKQTFESSILPTGLQNNVVGYDQKNTLLYSYKNNSNFNANNCDPNTFLLDHSKIEYKRLDERCNLLFNTPSTNTNDKSKCYQREMCKNKNYADKIKSKSELHQNNIQSYIDSNTNFNIQIINIVNLSIGIVVTSVALYKFRV